MAVIPVTHDTAQDYDTDINQASVTLEASVVGFHVYMRITRAGVTLGDWKILDGAPPAQFTVIRHDSVVVQLPCGTGTITVNRV